MTIARSIGWKRADTYALLGALVWALLLVLLPPFESLFFRGDMTYFTAMEYAIRAAAGSGQLPLWNPFFAEPLLANPQAMALYPLSVLLRFLPIPAYVVVFAWLHIFLFFAASYLLLRHWGFSRVASGSAAAGVSFSAFVLIRLAVGHILFLPIFVWSVFGLLSFAKLLHDDRFMSFIAALASAALLILSGHTQFSFTGLLLIGSYGVFYVAQRRDWQAAGRVVKHVALLGLALTGLLGVQLLPSAEYFLSSMRIDGMSLDWALRGSLTPLTSLNVLLSYSVYALVSGVNVQETLMFTTLMMPGFLLFALLFSPQRFRPLVTYATFVAVLAVMLSLGKHLPFYRSLVYSVFPMFRAPGRFLMWLLWPFSVAVAVTVDTLRESSAAQRRFVLLGAGLLLLDLALTVLYVARQMPPQTGTLAVGLVGTSLALWGVALVLRARLSAPAWVAAVAVCILLDSTLHAAFVGVWLPDHPSYADMMRGDSAVTCLSGELDPLAGRLHQRDYGVGMLRLAATYGVQVIHRHSANIAWVTDISREVPRLLQIDYLVAKDVPGRAWLPRETACDIALYERRGAHLPKAYVVDGLRVVGDDETLSAIIQPDFDPMQTVIVSEAEMPAAEAAPPGGDLTYELRVETYTANRIAIVVDTSADGMLVVSDPYYPGWQAAVDGAPAPVLRVDHGLRGVWLEGGSHAVELRYAPRSFRLGLALSGVTMLALSAAFVVSRRRAEAL